jgi:DNA ligase-associated metallophosphoesterase
MRAAAIPIPWGTTTADLARLTAIVRRTGAARMVLLGDVIHARAGRAPRTLAAIAEWRACHPELEIVLIRGNHDRHAGDPPADLGIRCVDAPETEAPFVFQHFPAPSPNGYTLAGHIHPAIKLRGIASERLTVPCFHFTPTHATLPAFGSMTGNALIHPEPGDRVYGIAGEEVVRIL